MAEQLNLPVDLERLPEYRLLCGQLRARGSVASLPPPEVFASHLFLRLFVELAYAARSTNRPGYLGPAKALFEESVGAMFGDDCKPLALLQACTLLEERDGDLFCSLFARGNEHLAGNHISKEKRGQRRSEFVRQEKELTHLALTQVQLIPPLKFRRADGTVLTPVEVSKAMLVVTRVDRALKQPNRQPGEFTEGLIADAAAVGMAHSQDTIKEVCFWLLEAREHPGTPKTTEQILAQWDSMMVMAGIAKPVLKLE